MIRSIQYHKEFLMSEIKIAVGSSACKVLQPTVKADKATIIKLDISLLDLLY